MINYFIEQPALLVIPALFVIAGIVAYRAGKHKDENTRIYEQRKREQYLRSTEKALREMNNKK